MKNGALILFKKYASLKDILEGVYNKDDSLNKLHKFLDFRSAVRLATIKYIVEGKNEAIDWFKELVIEDKDYSKEEILNKMVDNWF